MHLGSNKSFPCHCQRSPFQHQSSIDDVHLVEKKEHKKKTQPGVPVRPPPRAWLAQWRQKHQVLRQYRPRRSTSTDHAINQSIKQSTNQSMNEPLRKLLNCVNQPTNQWTNHTTTERTNNQPYASHPRAIHESTTNQPRNDKDSTMSQPTQPNETEPTTKR